MPALQGVCCRELAYILYLNNIAWRGIGKKCCLSIFYMNFDYDHRAIS